MYGEDDLSELFFVLIVVGGDGMRESEPSPENGTIHYEIEILRDGDDHNGKKGIFLFREFQ